MAPSKCAKKHKARIRTGESKKSRKPIRKPDVNSLDACLQRLLSVFHKQTVEAVWLAFRKNDNNSNGKLGKDEMTGFLGDLYFFTGVPRPTDQMIRDEVIEFFRQYDCNLNNQIEGTEMVEYLLRSKFRKALEEAASTRHIPHPPSTDSDHPQVRTRGSRSDSRSSSRSSSPSSSSSSSVSSSSFSHPPLSSRSSASSSSTSSALKRQNTTRRPRATHRKAAVKECMGGRLDDGLEESTFATPPDQLPQLRELLYNFVPRKTIEAENRRRQSCSLSLPSLESQWKDLSQALLDLSQKLLDRTTGTTTEWDKKDSAVVDWVLQLPEKWKEEGMVTSPSCTFAPEDIVCPDFKHTVRWSAEKEDHVAFDSTQRWRSRVCCVLHNLREVVDRIYRQMASAHALGKWRTPPTERDDTPEAVALSWQIRLLQMPLNVAIEGIVAAFVYTYNLQSPTGEARRIQIYHEMNRAMREYGNETVRDALDGDDAERYFKMINIFRPLIRPLEIFLIHLRRPDLRRTVFRGIRTRVSRRYQLGTLVPWCAFSSASKKSDVALSFVDSKAGTFFAASSLTGANIDFASMFPFEEEVLFPPNTIFEVGAKLSDNLLVMLGTKNDIVVMHERQAGDRMTPKETVDMRLSAIRESGIVYNTFMRTYIEPTVLHGGKEVKLTTMFDNFMNSEAYQMLVIRGDGGCGKTSAGLALTYQLLKDKEGPLPVFVSLPAIEGLFTSKNACIHHLQRMLHIDLYTSAESTGPELDELRTRPLVLFLDSLDEVPGDMTSLGKTPLLEHAGLHLAGWPKMKVVLTVRGEFLEEHNIAMQQISTEPADVARILPFNDEAVSQYVEGVVALEIDLLLKRCKASPTIDKPLRKMRCSRADRSHLIVLHAAMRAQEKRLYFLDVRDVQRTHVSGFGSSCLSDRNGWTPQEAPRRCEMMLDEPLEVHGVVVIGGTACAEPVNYTFQWSMDGLTFSKTTSRDSDVLSAADGSQPCIREFAAPVTAQYFRIGPHKCLPLRIGLLVREPTNFIDDLKRGLHRQVVADTMAVVADYRKEIDSPFLLHQVVEAGDASDVCDGRGKWNIRERWLLDQVHDRLPREPILMKEKNGDRMVVDAGKIIAGVMFCNGAWRGEVRDYITYPLGTDASLNRSLLACLPLRIENAEEDSSSFSFRHKTVHEHLLGKLIDDLAMEDIPDYLSGVPSFTAKLLKWVPHTRSCPQRVKNGLLKQACLVGNLDLLKSMLGEGASVTSQDSKKCTALHIAVTKGDKAMVSVLLEKRASEQVNMLDEAGLSVAEVAVAMGNLEVLKILLEKGAKVNTGTITKIVKEKCYEGCINAIKAARLVNYEFSCAELETAVEREDRSLVDYFMQTLKIRPRERGTQEQLIAAIESGLYVRTKVLLATGASPSDPSTDGRHPLDIALARLTTRRTSNARCTDQKTREDIVELLLRAGAGKAKADHSRQLTQAVGRGEERVVHLLLEAGCPPLGIDTAVQLGHMAIAHNLAQHGAKCSEDFTDRIVEALHAKRHNEARDLLRAFGRECTRHEVVLAEALSAGANAIHIIRPYFRSEVDNMLIQHSTDSSALTTLLQGGANPNAVTYTGSTAVDMAIETNNIELLRLVAQYSSINVSETTKKTNPLDRALQENKYEIAEVLLGAGAVPQGNCMGYMAKAVEAKFLPVVSKLIDIHAGVKALEKPTVLRNLVRCGADMLRVVAKKAPTSLLTCLYHHLWAACKEGEADVVQSLLEAGLGADDPRPPDLDGVGATLLETAISRKHTAVVSVLLRCRANPNVTSQGRTALDLCLTKRCYSSAAEVGRAGGLATIDLSEHLVAALASGVTDLVHGESMLWRSASCKACAASNAELEEQLCQLLRAHHADQQAFFPYVSSRRDEVEALRYDQMCAAVSDSDPSLVTVFVVQCAVAIADPTLGVRAAEQGQWEETKSRFTTCSRTLALATPENVQPAVLEYVKNHLNTIGVGIETRHTADLEQQLASRGMSPPIYKSFLFMLALLEWSKRVEESKSFHVKVRALQEKLDNRRCYHVRENLPPL